MKVGVDGVARGMRLAMDGATALWACLPNQHSTTWHACLICGHAYPPGTPSHGMLAGSVGTLTHPALRLVIMLA